MPYAIDEDKLNAPDLKVLDLAHPPMKQIAFQPFPQMIYLHPKDKTQEHRTKIVENKAELDRWLAIGWRENPHIPQAPPEDLSGFEVEYEGEAEPVRRGPGRPPKAA